MSDNPINRMGEARRGRPFPKGVSGNPNGKVSLKKDLERARVIGIPAEITKVLDEWLEDGSARLSELGAEGFISGLRAAMTDAAARVLPMTPEEARAWWWRTILPIAFAGPQRDKDSNWQYAHGEVGVRLLGKPKETVVLEGGESAPVDWSKVPEDEREGLLAAIMKLQAYLGEPETETEH